MKVEQVGEHTLRIFIPPRSSTEESVVMKLANDYFAEVSDEGFHRDFYYQDLDFQDKDDLLSAKEELKPWTRK